MSEWLEGRYVVPPRKWLLVRKDGQINILKRVNNWNDWVDRQGCIRVLTYEYQWKPIDVVGCFFCRLKRRMGSFFDPLYGLDLEQLVQNEEKSLEKDESTKEKSKVVRNLISKWQPIETAPQDGTDVLLFLSDDRGRTEIDIASWDDDGWEGRLFSVVAWNVTHWMPLPELPEGEEA